MGNIKKLALILSSESVNMLIRGVVAAMRVVRKYSKCTSIVFLLYLQQFISTPLTLLYASKVATELWIRDFTIFRTVIIFVLIFRPLLYFRMRWKSPNFFFLKFSFHWWKRFALSTIVFEKMDVKFRVRIRPNLNFSLLLLCYVNTCDKVVPK